ncbi:MAG: DUF4388 domain-containing protein [Planctomycetota bacterium]|jgi:hypothetical protein
MPLKGDLASFSLAEIFQSLSLNQSNGTLMVSDGENRSHLLFSSGQIVPLTEIPLHVAGIEQFLLKQGIIEPEILESLEEDSGPRTGLMELLVQEGIAKEDDLLPILRERMEEVIYDLFLWEDAYFEFKKDEVPQEYEDHLDRYRKVNFASSTILMEAVRRVDEWGRITSRIPSLKYIFVHQEKEGEEPPASLPDAPLSPAELWPHLTEKNNLAKVMEVMGATKFDVCRTVYAMLQSWLVRPLPPDRLEMAFKEALREHDFSRCIMALEYAQVLGLGARDVQERMMVALLSDRVFVASPEKFHLLGNLEDINFANFFLALFLKKHSGTIRVEDSESKKIIYFSPTEIAILSTGAREQLKFGEILIREGKLTYRELDRALTMGRERGDLLGLVLTQEEMITEEDMVFAIRKKIIDEIFDIFLWRNARFEFIKNQTPEEFLDNRSVSRLPLVSGTHLKELLASLTRFGEISKQLSSRAIFQRLKKERRESKGGVLGTWLGQMSEEEEQGEKDPLIDLVNGQRAVHDLIRISRGRGIEICERLFHLLNRGVITALSGQEIKKRCTRALEENQPRQGLRLCEFALERGYDRTFFTKALEDLKARNPGLLEGTREYKLEGDFESFSLADLFQSLYLNKHSGTLKVADGVNEKMVYISKGSICLQSRGSREVSRLGDILVDAGKVSEGDVSRALEVQKKAGKRIGELLVEEGLVTETDIQDAIREKIKEELFDIFLWDRASFTFTKNYFPEEFTDSDSRATRLELDTTRILMTAINRIEEWGRIEEVFKTTKAVFHVPSEEEPSLEGMSRKEKAILSLIDGRNNLEDIIDRSGVGRFKSCQILYQFHQKGVAQPMTLDQLNEEAEEAFRRREFELCVKYYEYAMRLDEDNVELRQTLDLLRGNIDQGLVHKKIRIKGVDLASLFSNLIREMRSGTLTAKDAKSRRFLYLAPDELLLLTEGERKGPSVEDILLEKGKVTEKVLERARDRQKKLGTDLAYILEKQGIIPYNDIERLRKKQVFEEIEDLFQWKDVSIEFEPNFLPPILEDPAKEVLSLRMDVWEMLKTIVDRIFEWNQIRKAVTSEDLIFVTAPDETRKGRVLHPLGEKLFSLMNGKSSLKEIFEQVPGDWFERYRALKKLIDANLIRPMTVEEAVREAENALVFNEQQTAENLYQSVLVVQPGNTTVRRKLESLRRKSTTRRRLRDSTIREVKLRDVLQNVVEQTRSGTLTAKGEDCACTLYVSPERILLLSSGERRGRYIGEILIECGFANPGQIEKGLTYQQKTRKRLGEILILQGVVTEEKLNYGLREKILEDLHNLFRWENARFHFDEGPPPEALTAEEVPVTDFAADGHELLKETLEREKTWAEISKILPSDKAVLLLLDTEVRKKGAKAKANPLMHLINGKRNITEIIRKLPGSVFFIYRDLARMIRAQSIRPLTREEAKKAGNEAYMFNEFKVAITLYEWALELHPDDPKVKSNLDRAKSFLHG